MRELVGKLSALDPEASETLKVVSFFDALTTNRVGLAGLLRSAAVLADAVAGAEREGRVSRFDPAGLRLPDVAPRPDAGYPRRAFGEGAVWIEREGAPHANDEMILERLAFAVGLLDAQNGTPGGLSVALDASRSIEDRIAALSRLRIMPDARVRIVATAAGDAHVGSTTTVMPTRYGLLQATLDVDGSVESIPPAGLGPWVRADDAPESWEGAVIAYRLHTPSTPVVDAHELGAMLALIRGYDATEPHSDVRALEALDRRTSETLRALVESESIRSAAAELAMHHSTLQAKHEALTELLGYDPRTVNGRMRYIAAEMLRRLA